MKVLLLELLDDVREGFVGADVAREDDVGDARGDPVDGGPEGDDAGEHRSDDSGAPDLEALRGDVGGGDPALRDDESGSDPLDDAVNDGDDRRGDRARLGEGGVRIESGEHRARGAQDDRVRLEGGGGLLHELADVLLCAVAGDDPRRIEDEHLGLGPRGEPVELAGGDADVRADDDEAAGARDPPGARLRDLLGGERLVGDLPDALADEGRADAVDEARAGLLGADEGEGEGSHVRGLDDVDRDGLRISGAPQDLDRPIGVGAQGLYVDEEDLPGRGAAAGLLLHPVRDHRMGVPEGVVLRELGLGGGDVARFGGSGVVDPAQGDPPGLGEGGDEDDPVDSAFAVLLEGGGDRVGLEGEVAAERRVGAGDEIDLDAEAFRRGEGGGDDLAIDALRVGGGEGARVRHHVDGGGARREGPVEVSLLPCGEDGQICDGLGARRVVVEDDEDGAPGGGGAGGVDVGGGDGGLRGELCDEFVAAYERHDTPSGFGPSHPSTIAQTSEDRCHYMPRIGVRASNPLRTCGFRSYSAVFARRSSRVCVMCERIASFAASSSFERIASRIARWWSWARLRTSGCEAVTKRDS